MKPSGIYYSIVFLFLSFLLILNLDNFNPNLWFDESGQFWMAKGLNHFSEPFQKTGSVLDVIKANRSFNLDPGGYTLLLHFWTMLSDNYIWLRLLSFVFLLGTCYLFYILSLRWTGNRMLALLLGMLPFLSPQHIHYGFEIRAFSMEYFSTT